MCPLPQNWGQESDFHFPRSSHKIEDIRLWVKRGIPWQKRHTHTKRDKKRHFILHSKVRKSDFIVFNLKFSMIICISSSLIRKIGIVPLRIILSSWYTCTKWRLMFTGEIFNSKFVYDLPFSFSYFLFKDTICGSPSSLLNFQSCMWIFLRAKIPAVLSFTKVQIGFSISRQFSHSVLNVFFFLESSLLLKNLTSFVFGCEPYLQR